MGDMGFNTTLDRDVPSYTITSRPYRQMHENGGRHLSVNEERPQQRHAEMDVHLQDRNDPRGLRLLEEESH
jgi:hypothetical protein